ncbi:MAG TPA: hypothetical protein VG407_02025 [Caulobacteraceae bacterium]|nr:hypothetical protein [Caulobacteraceae bacterium]
MGRANVVVSTELREWLYAAQVWRAGIYILDDKTYGDSGHYLDVISDRLAPGFHGVRHIVVEGGTIRFKADGDNG